MSQPTDLDYQAAIQNPRLVFSDPELQSGQPEKSTALMGLPKARSGNFAVAYRMICGPHSWAVKCFTRGLHPDLQARYSEISRYLKAKRPPYAVDFTFLSEGIRVDSQWFPILKMEWIDGESLTRYVNRNIRNHAALIQLATRWIDMARALQDAGIEHGDLQHGNVLIVNGNIRLIDYDGMFVPSLAGRPSHERGHENYQHPLRDTEFGPGLDNFSTWVILISILALAYEPHLWSQFNGGDDCLLFRKGDFAQPDRSRLLAALMSSREPRIQSLASLFRNILFMPPQQVPSLNGQFVPSALSAAQPAAVHTWISEHLGQVPVDERPVPTRTIATEMSAPPDMSSWMLDFVDRTPPVRATFGRPNVDRVIAALSMVLGGLICFGVAKEVLPIVILLSIPGIVVANIISWLIGYNREPVVERRRERESSLAQVQDELTRSETNVRTLELEKWRSDTAGAAEAGEFNEAQRVIEKRQLADLEIPRSGFRAAAERIRAHRNDIDRRENLALRQIQNGSGARLVQLGQQIAALAQGESAEVAKALASLQQQSMANALRTATLERADIPGVGEGIKANLRASGIFTAAEADRVAYVKVKGVGDQKRAAVLNWRHSVETRARARMPTSLASADTSAIQSKYRSQRTVLESERDRVHRQNADEVRALQAQVSSERQACVQLENSEADKLRRGEAQIVARYAGERAKCAAAAAAAAAGVRSRSQACERRLQDARKSCFSIRWRCERVRQEVASFGAVNFGRYVLRIVPGMSS